jgi:hypothetical protein
MRMKPKPHDDMKLEKPSGDTQLAKKLKCSTQKSPTHLRRTTCSLLPGAVLGLYDLIQHGKVDRWVVALRISCLPLSLHLSRKLFEFI